MQAQDVRLPEPVVVSLLDERGRCASGGRECAGKVLNFAAFRNPGWALYPKNDANSCPQPVTGTRVSCDILIWLERGLYFDVLSDSEGLTIVSAGAIGQPVGDNLFVLPVDPGNVPPPPVPNDLEERVAKLELRAAATEDALNSLTARLIVVEHRDNGVPEARVKELIDAAFFSAFIDGYTDRDFLGLRHRVKLPVSRR